MKQMIKHLYLLCLVNCALCLILLSGCSRGLPVNFVEGTVIFDGSPVADADVSFVPAAAGQGITATGLTDANGIFRLTSTQGGAANAGAAAGKYQVQVSKFRDLGYDKVTEQWKGKEIPLGAVVPTANPKHCLPEKYADAKTSGLTAEVKPGKNTFTLTLTSK